MAAHPPIVGSRASRVRLPLILALATAGFVIAGLVSRVAFPIEAEMGWGFRGFVLVVGLPYAVLGAAVSLRSPDNVIGRLLQVMGFSFVLANAIQEYALYGLIYRPGSLPGALYGAWILQWAWIVMFGLSMFVFLVFPNGRFASHRWRRFSLVAGSSIVLAAGVTAVVPRTLDSFTTRPAFQNPLGWSAISVDVGDMALGPWLVCLMASALSLLIRFRRSSGIERQQLKWLAMGALFTAFAFVAAGISVATAPGVGVVVTTIGIVLLPTTIGIAILRYRLYDIDTLINRAIVYAVLTAALVLAYLLLVFGFQAVLEPFTAESDLAIAASTLGVAALFRPIRSRVQDFIDRRFYRSKFDAERTVAEFSTRLRNEVELGAVTTQLAGVVRETMQPAHVSVWIRPAVER